MHCRLSVVKEIEKYLMNYEDDEFNNPGLWEDFKVLLLEENTGPNYIGWWQHLLWRAELLDSSHEFQPFFPLDTFDPERYQSFDQNKVSDAIHFALSKNIPISETQISAFQKVYRGGPNFFQDQIHDLDQIFSTLEKILKHLKKYCQQWKLNDPFDDIQSGLYEKMEKGSNQYKQMISTLFLLEAEIRVIQHLQIFSLVLLFTGLTFPESKSSPELTPEVEVGAERTADTKIKIYPEVEVYPGPRIELYYMAGRLYIAFSVVKKLASRIIRSNQYLKKHHLYDKTDWSFNRDTWRRVEQVTLQGALSLADDSLEFSESTKEYCLALLSADLIMFSKKSERKK